MRSDITSSFGSSSKVAQGCTADRQPHRHRGVVTFKSIFPGAYQGRWPHIRFEVYPSLAAATSASNKIATSQLALPEDVCDTLYATSGYEQSVRTMAQTSLARDNVFSDGAARQLATVTGTVAGGYVAGLYVPVENTALYSWRRGAMEILLELIFEIVGQVRPGAPGRHGVSRGGPCAPQPHRPGRAGGGTRRHRRPGWWRRNDTSAPTPSPFGSPTPWRRGAGPWRASWDSRSSTPLSPPASRTVCPVASRLAVRSPLDVQQRPRLRASTN